MKDIVFLSGLPRTGSTVLCSILNQSSEIYATTTSPVADMASIIMEKWNQLTGAMVDRHPKQYSNIILHTISGAWEHVDKKIVVDKSRLWPRLVPHYHAATGIRPKIICTVRNIPEILASYVLLTEKNPSGNFVDDLLVEAGLTPNTKNRCKIALEKFIQYPYNSLKIGYNSGVADMYFVDYNDIVVDPQGVVNSICGFIGCKPFTVDSSNISPMDENDEYHGGMEGLHSLRPVLARTSPPPTEVIGYELTRQYSSMQLEFWKKPPPNVSMPTRTVRPGISSTGHPADPAPLEGDSLDYDLLYRAASSAIGTDGLYCEIGVRRGGSLRYIIDALHDSNSGLRHLVAMDPYGNIDYNATQQYRGKLDYTNEMKNESMPNIYNYAYGKNVNLVFFNLEDTEFFRRFETGVPVYNQQKNIINKYAFVFFDGPHDSDSLLAEVDFFLPRSSPGTVYVFDDVATYPHNIIHNYILDRGFEVLEVGRQGRKISYRLV